MRKKNEDVNWATRTKELTDLLIAKKVFEAGMMDFGLLDGSPEDSTMWLPIFPARVLQRENVGSDNPLFSTVNEVRRAEVMVRELQNKGAVLSEEAWVSHLDRIAARHGLRRGRGSKTTDQAGEDRQRPPIDKSVTITILGDRLIQISRSASNLENLTVAPTWVRNLVRLELARNTAEEVLSPSTLDGRVQTLARMEKKLGTLTRNIRGSGYQLLELVTVEVNQKARINNPETKSLTDRLAAIRKSQSKPPKGRPRSMPAREKASSPQLASADYPLTTSKKEKRRRPN